MTTWFTSDQHFGHARIIELCNRPFGSVEEMDETLVARWNERVAEDDVVYVLGDLALGTIKVSMTYAARLNGQKILVPGNHDRCWSGHRKIRPQDTQIYLDVGFIIGAEHMTFPLYNGRVVALSHMPYVGDSHDEDRFESHRPADEGRWLLHGHVHDAWQVRPRMINVGVDVWDYAPVEEATLIAEIALAELTTTTG